MIYVFGIGSLHLLSECANGYFGLNCGSLCSGHCESNDPCDHVSGVCPGGCQDGYMEQYCNRCKKQTPLFLNDLLHIILYFLYLTVYSYGFKLARPDIMGKIVLFTVLQTAMRHVNLKMNHVQIAKKVGHVIVPEVNINDLQKLLM